MDVQISRSAMGTWKATVDGKEIAKDKIILDKDDILLEVLSELGASVTSTAEYYIQGERRESKMKLS